MNNIKILDCTLRDGARLFDCKFDTKTLLNITKDLTKTGLDIIEIGFLRDDKDVEYKGDSTFFTSVSQMKKFIPFDAPRSTKYVAFIDFDMYDFSKLEYCDNETITGIRVGFTKENYRTMKEDIKKALISVKEKGYDLFIQGVNTLGYSDVEMLDIVSMVNEIKPYGFGIVDTYGGMYLDDIVHYYNLVDYNLDDDVTIDIHTHNNFQSSFAFAQEIIKLSGGTRKLIFDSTLNGIGKASGNLNTELIADFLVRKKNYGYNIDIILDCIDRYIAPFNKEHDWGYSIPAFMAGIYKSHPNNIIYLTNKYRLNSKDIKYIISGIDEKTRQKYDYDNINEIYKNYNKNLIDDSKYIEKLKRKFTSRSILILAPGKTIKDYKNEIQSHINKLNPIVISVNFIPDEINCDYYFYTNTIHWEKVCEDISRDKCILTSNIHDSIENIIRLDYSSLIVEDSFLFDNSVIMLLNLLKIIGVSDISIAGFDGHVESNDNYVNENFNHVENLDVKKINNEVRSLYNKFVNRVSEKANVNIITPSLYKKLD